MIVKADAGAGAFRTVHDAKELLELKLARHAVARVPARTGKPAPDLLLQEGVPTFERINGAVAEPVVYLIDRYVVGGFYRARRARRRRGPERARSSFVRSAFAEANQLARPGVKPGAAHRTVLHVRRDHARLGVVAASYELEATDPNAEIDG